MARLPGESPIRAAQHSSQNEYRFPTHGRRFYYPTRPEVGFAIGATCPIPAFTKQLSYNPSEHD